MSKNSLPWYKNGLSFKCTGCGQCCTGFPGHVWVTMQEIQNMADVLKISSEEFLQKYVRKVGSKLSLKELPKTYDCIFLKGKRCMVYEARPSQCKTFPWWDENLENKEAWEDAASRCEGINHPDAPLITLEEISSHLK